MAASKPLILLKGIGGLAATSLATLGGMEVGYKFLSSKTIERTESEEGSWDIEFEPEEYTEEISGLGIPNGCDETCELTAEELRGLRFESRNSSSILFDGLIETDTFELAISGVSEDPTNYPRGKKYILKAKSTAQTVTIKNVKGDDIVLGEEGVDLRETNEGGWLEKVPEEVNDLGIPKRCEGDPAEDQATKTCELTREQLQRLKLETKEENTSISVRGLKNNEKVELTISSVSGDTADYPHGKKYTLTSKTRTVTIRGVKDGDVVLEANQGVDFREKQDGNKLETVEDSLGIPRRCNETCQLKKEELEKLKFETETGSSIIVEGQTEPVTLTIEDKENDPTNYPKGKKYTLKAANGEVTIRGVKGGEIEIGGENGEVVIREKESGGKLEKAPEEVNELGIPKGCNRECQLTKDQLQRFKFEPKGNEEITVEGLAEGNRVTLKIEDKNGDINYPKGKKYTLKSTTGTVTIRNVKEGDIEIKTGGDAVIRETGRGGKLEEVSEELDKLGIPKRCTTTHACQLTKDQLQRLTFETKNSGGITVTGLGSNDTVDLKVVDPGDSINFPHGKKYTLTSKGGKVTIRGVKEGEIVLDSGNDVVFREKESGGLLEKASEEVDKLGIPWRCVRSSSECELTKEQLKRLKFEAKDNKSSIWVTGLGNSDRVTLKVNDPSDKTNYPKDRRYIFKAKKDGVTIKGTKDWDIELEKDKELLVRETIEGGKLETVVDSLGIPRSCNANEVTKGSAPQSCQLTEELLKNIKFKTFGGKRADAKVTVTGLDGGTIKLKISWTEDKNYPDNKKYSFDNTDLWRGKIKISKDDQTEKITIVEKKESWFKNVNGQLELVWAKTKSQVKIEETNEILEKLGLGSLELKSSRDFTTSIYSDQHNRRETSFTSDDELKKIKFKDLDGSAEDTNPSGLNNNKKITVSLDWDKDTGKYPYNMKITFKNESISPSFCLKNKTKTVEIVKKVPNVFKVENQDDKWYLVKTS